MRAEQPRRPGPAPPPSPATPRHDAAAGAGLAGDQHGDDPPPDGDAPSRA